MEKKRIILLIIGLILIIGPFFLNFYSVYKLISVALGILLIDIFLATKSKTNIFLLIYLPIILVLLTYSIDYIKTYTLKLSPIYVLENKINDDVSIYNSIFYRVFKCQNEYIFDNDYEKNFACSPTMLENIDINKLLNEPEESFHEYKNDFIKITGKISKINGNTSIELREYTIQDNAINGYVKFNETSKLTVNLKNINISNYKIYDYITVVGLLENFNKDSMELSLTSSIIEKNDLYDKYDFQVILSNNCDNSIKEYTDNFYTKCIENIYLDYKIDKYELSYALKDGKITLEEIINNSEIREIDNKKLYKLEKFNILSCSENKNILLNNNEVDYSLCDE